MAGSGPRRISPVQAIQELLQSHSPDWHADAACRGMARSPEGARIFFPGPGESHKPAKEICGRCPVKQECDEDSANETNGIWGGEIRQP